MNLFPVLVFLTLIRLFLSIMKGTGFFLSFLLLMLACFPGSVACAQTSTSFLKQVETAPPQSVLPYWEHYSSIHDIRAINTAYVSIDSKLTNRRLQIINELAYVKCVVELSLLDKSFEMLRDLKKEVNKQDDYIKGSYYLVFARLLFRVNRGQEAIVSNEKAIRYLKKTNYLADLKNAYLNQGYFYSAVNDSLTLANYDRAAALERKGVMEFYVLLRTNLALQSLLKNDTKTALIYCNEARVYLRNPENRNYLDEFRTLIIMASIYELEGNLPQEERFLEQAKQLSYKHQMILNLTSITHSQSFNYASKNDYKNAYLAMREMDSLKRVLAINQVSENLAVYDLEDKIAAEKSAKKRINERLEVKRQQQRVLVLFLLLLFATLIGITWLLVNIRKKNRVLLEQNLALARTEEVRTRPESDVKESNLDLIIELEKLMFDKELYRQSNLTVDRIAKKLNTNRTYLSEAINAHYKTNYSSWINTVRINASRKLLASAEYDHYSIEGIAKMVGYTSISSFNASFKKITGLTPSHFKKMRHSADIQ